MRTGLGEKVTMAAIKFPVICINRNMLRIRHDEESLTTTTKAGLKNGMFDNLLIIDVTGKAHRVSKAKKLHGVGAFWGYNIFLNQKIKVQLIFEGEPYDISLDQVRELIFKDLRNWHGWSSREDFNELKQKVREASSISQLIQGLES